MLNKKQAGFTLVEIAIVLVIVGLLIGGVLKGQEMITNAKLKRVESDNAGLLAALYSYQDRYLQLPGDDGDAEARFTIYNGDLNVNGNGDGAIGLGTDWLDTVGWSAGTQETTKFFGHLRAAGLIAGGANDANRPTNAFGGQIGIQEGSLGMVGQITIFGNIDGGIAKILDGRLDDGAMGTGRVRSAPVVNPYDNAMHASATPAAASVAYNDSVSYHMAFRL
jgi:prepilin-type N-terminal cleavage/methylation domain-containing protein